MFSRRLKIAVWSAVFIVGAVGAQVQATPTTIYVPSIDPQIIATPTGDVGSPVFSEYFNQQGVESQPLFTHFQYTYQRTGGTAAAVAGPATNGTPQMLQGNAFDMKVVGNTKVTFAAAILKNPNATVVDPTGMADGATDGLHFYHAADYFTYSDLTSGNLQVSFSYFVPTGANAGPMATAIGFMTSVYINGSGNPELKWEPAYNSAETDQSSAANGVVYDNRGKWITTPNIVTLSDTWNIGGNPSGTLGQATLTNQFGSAQLMSLIFGMGTIADREVLLDDLHITYNGASGGTAFDYVYDFGDVAPGPVPEPASCSLLAIGGLLLVRRRRA